MLAAQLVFIKYLHLRNTRTEVQTWNSWSY